MGPDGTTGRKRERERESPLYSLPLLTPPFLLPPPSFYTPPFVAKGVS